MNQKRGGDVAGCTARKGKGAGRVYQEGWRQGVPKGRGRGRVYQKKGKRGEGLPLARTCMGFWKGANGYE